MRDGTRLYTEVLLPSGKPPFPAILIRGPYPTMVVAVTAMTMRDRGFAMVMQKSRGCEESEGKGAPLFLDDGWGENRDGHDTLAWINTQPWSNGRVGSFGFSAMGSPASLMAPLAPANLRAQYVLFAFCDMYAEADFYGGVWRKEVAEEFLSVSPDLKHNITQLIKHARWSEYWNHWDPSRMAPSVNAPGVFIGGWYDMFLQGSIRLFKAVQENGGPGARGKCRLVLGPWGHQPIQGLDYPKSDLYFDHPEAGDPWRFLDHHLKGLANGVPGDLPVHYYVMGPPADRTGRSNHWRSADRWPPPSVATPFYFHADGSLDRRKPGENDAKRTYRFDPNNPVPTLGGGNFKMASGPLPQNAVESRPDVLLFTTPELPEPLEASGPLAAELFISSDCPDTDFTVKLCDVYPDGTSRIVIDGIARARYHPSPRCDVEKLLEPGKVYRLPVDLWSTAMVFDRGHRIRIAVSSSNSPRFEPNPNTGKPFRADLETRIAANTVHLSSKYPSNIILPLYSGPPDRLQPVDK